MSDIHVLTGDGSQQRVVMHLPVPNTNNEVGVNYRTALVNSGLGGATTMTEGSGAGQINTVEKAKVEAGEVYEHSTTFELEGVGASTASQQAALRAAFTREKTAVVDKIQRQLKFFGHTESEA